MNNSENNNDVFDSTSEISNNAIENLKKFSKLNKLEGGMITPITASKINSGLNKNVDKVASENEVKPSPRRNVYEIVSSGSNA